MTQIATEIEPRSATLEDLLLFDGKAELIDGRIVEMMATGDFPGEIALNIALSLKVYVKQVRRGRVRGDFVGYSVPRLASGRQSFAPDASYYTRPRPKQFMRFVKGAPDFAVEVRSEGDYGPSAEVELKAKRSDYFEAGTRVVWDVDPMSKRIFCYQASNPDTPRVFVLGQIADAEPAVLGWRMPVADVFESD